MNIPVGENLYAPFKGLRFFEEQDAHIFFGRDEQIDEMSRKLQTSRFVAVIGSSGCGKSSLVRAGLAHRLSAGLIVTDTGSRWRTAVMRPGSAPVANLASALERTTSEFGLDTSLRRGPLGLVDVAREIGLQRGENLLILVDQFEELFRFPRHGEALGEADQEVTAFVKLLLEASNQKQLPIHVVLTMRSDFLGNCSQYRDLPERINDGLYLVPRMRRDQMEQAIVGPLDVVGANVAPRLVQVLLNEVGDDPDQLPVLQHTLLRTWNSWTMKRIPTRPIDLEDYEPVGPLKVSLSKHANEIYGRLSGPQRDLACVLFQRLIERDPENREVRHPASLEDMGQVAGTGLSDEIKHVIDQFSAPSVWFLIQDDQGMVDITHEALIRQWDKIQGDRDRKGWLQEEAEARDTFLELATRARRARSEDDLLSGGDLDRALCWQEGNRNAPWSFRYDPIGGGFAKTQQFIADSKSKRDRRRLKQRQIVAALVVLSLLASGTAVFATIKALEANRSRQTERSGQASLAALNVLADDPTRSVLLALCAAGVWRPADTAESEDTLRRAVDMRRQFHVLASGGNPVIAMAIDASGKRVARLGADGTVNVLDGLTGGKIVTLRHAPGISAVAISDEGQRIGTVALDGTVRVWAVPDGNEVPAPIGPQGEIVAMTFARGGRLAATIARDGAVRLWDISKGQAGPVFGRKMLPSVAPQGVAATAAQSRGAAAAPRPTIATFNEDGTYIGIVTAGGSFEVREVASGKRERFLRIDLGPSILDVALSPDLGFIATASNDGTVSVWDKAGGQPKVLRHAKAVTGVGFSRDGRYVVTSSSDTARMFEVATAREVSALRHPASVSRVAFGGEGRVFTASQDTLRIWEPGEVKMTHGVDVSSLAFAADGVLLATTSGDRIVAVWDVATRKRLYQIVSPNGPPLRAAFSRDKKYLAIAGADDTVTVWDLSGEPLKVQLTAPSDGRVTDLRFDGDTNLLKVVSLQSSGLRSENKEAFNPKHKLRQGAMLTTWNVTKPQEASSSVLIGDSVTSAAAISPDGRIFVTADVSYQGKVVVTAREPVRGRKPLWSHSMDLGVGSIVFSHEGGRLAVTATDGTTTAFEAATGDVVRKVPPGETGSALGPAFSHGGTHLAIASGRNIKIVDLQSTKTKVQRYAESVQAVAFSPTGQFLAAATGTDVTVSPVALDALVAEANRLVTEGAGTFEQCEKRLEDRPQAPGGS